MVQDFDKDMKPEIFHQEVAENESVNKYLDPEEVFEWSQEEERKVVLKADCYLLITIFWMYLLSYMDRTNIGNARVAGMGDDLELTSSMYSNALIIFFVFYVVFEIPCNLILVRIGPVVFIPTIMFIWGGLTCCFAAINSYGALMALRALVGVFEAGFVPANLLILSSWYKKEEQSKRFALFISAAILSGAFGGIIAGLITDHLHDVHGIVGWRWLFIVEGIATSGVAVIAYFLLLPLPHHLKVGKKFNEREIKIIQKRLEQDNVENNDGNDVNAWQALIANVKSLRVLLLIVGYMVIVGSSTLSYFYPTLVEGLGYSGPMVQYMTIPIYGAAFVLTLFVAYFSDKFVRLRGVFLSILLLSAAIFSVVVVVNYDYTTRYAMLCLMALALWAGNGLALSYAATTLSDKDSKTRGVGLALINALGNFAQIYGSYLFPTKDAPKYLMGFGVVTGMCFLGFVNYMILSIYVFKKFHRSHLRGSDGEETI